MKKPTVSIVVPHAGDRATLWECVKSLKEQTLDARHYEVIVVEDGTSLKAEAIKQLEGMGATVFQKPHSGVGATRNLGITHARGQLIVMLDNDCVADSGLLLAYLSFFKKNPDVAGAGGLVRSVPQNGVVAAYAAHRGLLSKPVMDGERVLTVITANGCFRRDALLAVGLFDTRLDTCLCRPGGDDADLSYRLRVGGYKLVCHGAAVAAHYHRTSWRGFAAQQMRNGAGLLVHARLRGVPLSDYGLPAPQLLTCIWYLLRFLVVSHSVSGVSLVRRVVAYAKDPLLPVRHKIAFPVLDTVRRVACVLGILWGNRRFKVTFGHGASGGKG